MIIEGLLSRCRESSETTSKIDNSYDNNSEAGEYVYVNGVNIYYEVYGNGNPLVLLHSNGGNIEEMKYQNE